MGGLVTVERVASYFSSKKNTSQTWRVVYWYKKKNPHTVAWLGATSYDRRAQHFRKLSENIADVRVRNL